MDTASLSTTSMSWNKLVKTMTSEMLETHPPHHHHCCHLMWYDVWCLHPTGEQTESRWSRYHSMWPPSLTEFVFGGKGSPTVFRAKMYTIHVVMIIFRFTEGLLGSLLPWKLPENSYGIGRLWKGSTLWLVGKWWCDNDLLQLPRSECRWKKRLWRFLPYDSSEKGVHRRWR